MAYVISNRPRHIIETLLDVNGGAIDGVTNATSEKVSNDLLNGGAIHGVTNATSEKVSNDLLRCRKRLCKLNERDVKNEFVAFKL